MLAAIPSVVVGLWGIFVLAPFSAQHLRPWLARCFGWTPIFSSARTRSRTVFAAILVLTIMIDPDHLVDLPRALRQRSGRDQGGRSGSARRAGRWSRRVVPSVRGGVVAAVLLGRGRALGEAIAVTQVIGNSSRSSARCSSPATRSRAGSPTSTRARSRTCRSRRSSTWADPAGHVVHRELRCPAHRPAIRARARGAMTAASVSLQGAGRARRRLVMNRFAEVAAIAAAASAIAVLASSSGRCRARDPGDQPGLLHPGAGALRRAGGGIAPAIVGSALLVGIATIFALPFGVLTAIFVYEFAPKRIADQIHSGSTS